MNGTKPTLIMISIYPRKLNINYNKVDLNSQLENNFTI
jgi:hypothetical protein